MDKRTHHPARPRKGGSYGSADACGFLRCRRARHGAPRLHPECTSRAGRSHTAWTCPSSAARATGAAVSTSSASADETADEVSRLREQRTALEQLIRDLMKWIGLLRHKASSLRALAAGSARGLAHDRSTRERGDGLTPGSLDPRALAEALGADPSGQPPASSGHRSSRLVRGLSADEAITRARSMWDTVVDPTDAAACERLSQSADRLAASLQVRVDEALDQYTKLGDELTRALERGRRVGGGSVE